MFKNNKSLVAAALVFASGVAFGGVNTSNDNNIWKLVLGGGYAQTKSMLPGDNSTVVGRVAFGVNPWRWNMMTFGFEAGLQSGSTMKLHATDRFEDFGAIGTTFKPSYDLLGSMQISINEAETMFFVVKGGAIYREWTFSTTAIPTKNQFSPEVQVGIGTKLSPHVKISAYYQGIYSGGAGLTGSLGEDNTITGAVKNIPTQQGGFLGVEIVF